MIKILIFLFTITFSISSFSQVPEATPADKRLKGYEIRKELKENSLIRKQKQNWWWSNNEENGTKMK
jgi:hypothetical protein